MRTENKTILDVKNLKQYFVSGRGKKKITVKAVDDISFDIRAGEVFSLVGESGCGKTTTGRSIIKLYKSTGGEVIFHGQRIIADYKAAKKKYKAHEITREELIQVKLDRKFEKIKDKDEIKRLKGLNQQSEEVKHIVDPYEEEIAALEEKIGELNKQLAEFSSTLSAEDKTKYKNLKLEKKQIVEDIGFKKKLIKQDIKTYVYQKVHKNKLLMRRMQMIFQDPIASLNPRMTVMQIIGEGLTISGVKNKNVIKQKVKDALEAVGLVEEHASRYPHEFSGGQRQRIGIARSLVVNPSFIIADEPISALDVSIRAQVVNLLNDLRRDLGITIMFIAHDLSVVKYFSDRIGVMYFGKIVEIGDKEKIFKNPLHPYTISLLDAIPLPDPIYEQNRGDLQKYDPQTAHDYSVDKPTLRELEPDHFVLCNQKEFEEHQKTILNNENN